MQTYRTTHDEVRPFRGAVSIHDPAEIEQDLLPGAMHYLASDGERTLACLTAVPSQWLAFDAWRLYGLAFLDDGAALALIEHATRDACHSEGPHHLWCAVPPAAAGPLRRAGWKTAPGATVGDPVDRIIMVHNCRPTHLLI